MTKYWAFARGGAWRNPKPTGGPYVCEQCRLDACGGNDATLTIRLSQQPSWPLRTFAPTAGRGCWRNWRSKIEHDDPRYWMALFTDGGSRYLAIGRTPLRMTFPGLSRFPAWLPTYFPWVRYRSTAVAAGEGASMEKTGIREPLNSPILHPGPLDSAPGPAPTTRGILQNLPATPSPGNPQAVQVREGRPARESGEDSPTVS